MLNLLSTWKALRKLDQSLQKDKNLNFKTNENETSVFRDASRFKREMKKKRERESKYYGRERAFFSCEDLCQPVAGFHMAISGARRETTTSVSIPTSTYTWESISLSLSPSLCAHILEMLLNYPIRTYAPPPWQQRRGNASVDCRRAGEVTA